MQSSAVSAAAVIRYAAQHDGHNITFLSSLHNVLLLCISRPSPSFCLRHNLMTLVASLDRLDLCRAFLS